MRYDLLVTGYPVTAECDEAVARKILETLRGRLPGDGGRLIAFVAGPPGVGKSTLTAFLERFAAEWPGFPRVQALGMDGFHYPQAYIESHEVSRGGSRIPMKRVKGAPDTFDAEGLKSRLTLLKSQDAFWPAYDRRKHDVTPDALWADAPILLVEGNYLLLDEPVWRELPHDYAVFMKAEEAWLRDRLIARKIRGGLTAAQAETFYAECDGPNARLCLTRSLPADSTLTVGEKGIRFA